MSRIRSFFVFALLTSLAACGGGGGDAQSGAAPGSPDATIGGTITGLGPGGTLILTNSDAETIAVNGSGSFVFAKKVPAGGNYEVAIFGHPSGANCTVANGAGTVGANQNAISNVSITCTQGVVALVNFYVGVTVSGLSQGNSVTFTNNGTDTLTATGNGLFVFPYPYAKEGVYAGVPAGYGVAIKTNPPGQTCTLSNASGVLASSTSANFVNVLADCK